MIEQVLLDHIKDHAKRKRQAFLDKHPGVQVPPDEGTETLLLVAEIERLQARHDGDTAVTDWPVFLDQL